MPTGSALARRIRDRLATLGAAGLLRSLRAPGGVDLASNDYLRLASDPRVAARFSDAARRGCGSTGSRLLTGERAAFTAIEQRFAAFKGTDRALFFSSGYLANLAVLTTLPEAGDIVVADRACHASLLDGLRLSAARRLVFPHNDLARLRDLLARRAGSGVAFVVVESLFSMDGDTAPLARYVDLCRDAGAVLIVDEAHAVGVYGGRGSGLLEDVNTAGADCISINTAGKALGTAGAFVAGPDWAIEYLVQRARPFVFSTASPPAVAEALDASLTIVQTEPERRTALHRLSAYARTRLTAAGVAVPDDTSPIVPVVVGDNDRAVAVAGMLQRQGFDVRAIRPPAVPEGTARLRVSINVGLTEPVLDEFAGALAAALRGADVCCAASS